MKPPAPHAADRELVLLVIPTAWVGVAVDAARVDLITPEREWDGAAGLELARAVTGADGPPGDDPRIIVIRRRAGEPLVARATSTVRMQAVARSAVLPLPPILVRTARHAVRAVVLPEGAQPLLIVDPDAIVS